MNNQPKFKKGDSPVVDMLAIPDDHVWPETSGNEVVIVDELFEKQKESFIKAATSMTGSATLTPEFKAFGEFATKLDSVDQELEDAAIKSVGEIEDMAGMAGYNGFKKGANWKAEQSANDAIEFADWCSENTIMQQGQLSTRYLKKENKYYTTKELFELWQENQKRSITL